MNRNRTAGRSLAASLIGILIASTAVPAAVASEPVAAPRFTVYRSPSADARAMLERAVGYMQQNPAERAFAAFNNQGGAFRKNDLYVFVVGIDDGVMHANGGAPEALVGEDVRDLRDAASKPLIREMLDVATRDGKGTVDYVWLNRMTNKVENKTALLARVDRYVVGVGYYTR